VKTVTKKNARKTAARERQAKVGGKYTDHLKKAHGVTRAQIEATTAQGINILKMMEDNASQAVGDEESRRPIEILLAHRIAGTQDTDDSNGIARAPHEGAQDLLRPKESLSAGTDFVECASS
jgi:hypothetical protein